MFHAENSDSMLNSKILKAKQKDSKVTNKHAVLLKHDTQVCRRQGYRIIKLLGKGPTSRVYLVQDLNNTSVSSTSPAKVVVKIIDMRQMENVLMPSCPPCQPKCSDVPSHPNILRVLHSFINEDAKYLVTEWCKLGNLSTVISGEKTMERGMAEDLARNIFRQICSALLHLHVNGISHGGVILYAMLHGALPYNHRDLLEASRTLNMPPLYLRSSLSFLCIQLIQKLLTYSPFLRPELKDVMSDNWVNWNIMPTVSSVTKNNKRLCCKTKKKKLVLKQERSSISSTDDSQFTPITPMQRGQHEAKTVILVGNPQKSALQTLANMNLHYLPNQSSQTEDTSTWKDMTKAMRPLTWHEVYHNRMCINCLQKFKLNSKCKSKEGDNYDKDAKNVPDNESTIQEMLQQTEHVRQIFMNFYGKHHLSSSSSEFPMPPILIQ